MSSSFYLVLSGLVATYLFLRFLLFVTQDAKEPPVLETAIPFLGPMFGMRKKHHYYVGLRDKCNLPIYTLRLPFMRLYIINSTALIPIAQRHFRILDFAPMEAKVAINVMGASAEGRKILVRDRDGVEDFSYAIEFDRAIHPSLTLGPQLHAMGELAVRRVSEAVEKLADQTPRTLRLFDWVKREIAVATTEAVYGPKNPFRNPDLQAAYWRFEPGIIRLLLNVYPNLLARKSVQARKEIVDAFADYFNARGHEQGSAFVQAHYQHKIDQGVSGRDIASFEVGGIVAILSNTVPTAFWVLYHTISDAEILDECRREVLACCKVEGNISTLDISKVKGVCLVLMSILKETLRFHGIGTPVRVVTEDHVLDGKYLLKKGSIVMMPSPVQHTSTLAYGDNVKDFRHKRFVRLPAQEIPNPTAFRGFGGGSTLCPGRHFASTEVLAFVALMIVRFDFEPSSGEWIRPKTNQAGMHGTVAPPDEDVQVRITPMANELAGKGWSVILSGSERALDVSVEDIIA